MRDRTYLTASSTRNLSLIRRLFLFVTLLGSISPVEAATKSNFQVRLSAEAGWHLFEPTDLATNRYALDFDQHFVFSPHWSFSGGFRSAANSVFATNSRYYGPVVTDESYELMPRDLYVQYKNGPYLVRVGNQQVVWGEAFGFFYSDIINPKDLRQYLPADLEAARIPIPMINAKWIGAKNALQLVYIPYPFFDRIPNQGGDYFTISSPYPGATFSVNDPRTLPFDVRNGEMGLRATQLLGTLDLSIFYFSGFDREPNFAAAVTSLTPPSITLTSTHHRLQRGGLTATAELGPILFRLEGVYSAGRYFDAYDSGILTSVPSDELVAVIEADYGGLSSWHLGLQGAIDKLSTEIPGLLSPHVATVNARITRDFRGERSLTTQFSYAPADQSSLLRLAFANPLSNQLEFAFTSDFFLGRTGTYFGSVHDASRWLVSLRAYLGR